MSFLLLGDLLLSLFQFVAKVHLGVLVAGEYYIYHVCPVCSGHIVGRLWYNLQ